MPKEDELEPDLSTEVRRRRTLPKAELLWAGTGQCVESSLSFLSPTRLFPIHSPRSDHHQRAEPTP
jgi:hypothetical protein